MPERDAAVCDLGDGYVLTAAGLRREKDGALTADLMLQNGRILHADPAILNTEDGRHAWAVKAQRPGGPTAERIAEALREHILPDALAIVQEDPKKATQADRLIGMVSEMTGDDDAAIELFHDPGGTPYATIAVGDHQETWLLHSKSFRQWLARRYHEQHGKSPNAQALADATNVLAGKAIFDGPECRVHVRIAEHDGAIYLDLANERWEAIRIDRDGWRVETDPPVKFRRTRGMLPLPTPIPGGNLNQLRPFLNVPPPADDGDDASWIFTVSWLIAAYRPKGPYPLHVTHGEHGTAKSTGQRVLRALLDPNKAPIRSMPRDERDVMIAATNGWCLAFDNLSHLQDYLSDALCRISTGGGFAVRELYSDQDETILDVQRPMMLNGIEELATRSDLLDRSIVNYLPTIPPEKRRPEKDFWREFEEARPAILGAILDAVSMALRNEDTVTLDAHPRMADFAAWTVAAEPALPWEKGAFLTAYSGNQRDANDLTLEASPVAQAVREFAGKCTEPWTGTATALLNELEAITDEKTQKQKSWPASGRTLSNTLRRLAPNLRAVRIEMTFSRTDRSRFIRIENVGNSSSSSSSSSSTAQPGENTHDDETRDDDAHRHEGDSSSSPERQKPTDLWDVLPGHDDHDDHDDEMPTHSVWRVNPDGSEEEII